MSRADREADRQRQFFFVSRRFGGGHPVLFKQLFGVVSRADCSSSAGVLVDVVMKNTVLFIVDFKLASCRQVWQANPGGRERGGGGGGDGEREGREMEREGGERGEVRGGGERERERERREREREREREIILFLGLLMSQQHASI